MTAKEDICMNGRQGWTEGIDDAAAKTGRLMGQQARCGADSLQAAVSPSFDDRPD